MKNNKKKNKKENLIRLFVLFGLFFLWESCQAQEYFVSPSGVAIWPNCTTTENPCQASATAKEFLNAQAGDNINFLPGTYDPGDAPDWSIPAWTPANSGSSGSPITFKCELIGSCTILHNSFGPALGSSNRDYITWDGFTGSKIARFSFAYFSNSDYGIIQNFDIAGYENTTAENNSCIGLDSTNFMTIRNNKLHNATSMGSDNGASILMYSAYDSLIENNEIYDNDSGIFDKDDGHRNTFRFNYIHDNLNGWMLGAATGHESDDIFLYQNVFVENYNHMRIFNSLWDHNTVKIYNNTMHQNNSAYNSIIRESSQQVHDLNIYNNIVINTNRALRIISADTITEIDYNLYWNVVDWRLDSTPYYDLADWRLAIGAENNSIEADPNLINVGGSDSEDYKLADYSSGPAVGSGKDGVNLGAYISGYETIGLIGPDDIVAPNFPIGLSVF